MISYIFLLRRLFSKSYLDKELRAKKSFQIMILNTRGKEVQCKLFFMKEGKQERDGGGEGAGFI